MTLRNSLNVGTVNAESNNTYAIFGTVKQLFTQRYKAFSQKLIQNEQSKGFMLILDTSVFILSIFFINIFTCFIDIT